MTRQLRRLWRTTRLLCHLAGGCGAGAFVHGPSPRLQCSREPSPPYRAVVDGAAVPHLQPACIGGGPDCRRAGAVRGQSCVVACVPSLLSAVDVTFVVKREVRHWPLVGTLADRAGTLFVARGARDGAAATAERMTWLLQQRRSVVIFPEGTTTDGSYVQRFYPRLFQAAIHTGAPVQAVAIEYPRARNQPAVAPFVGDDELEPPIWKLLAEDRIQVRLSFCAPIQSNESPHFSLRIVARATNVLNIRGARTARRRRHT